MKLPNSLKGVFGPQMPSRFMYAMFLGSEAPGGVTTTKGVCMRRGDRPAGEVLLLSPVALAYTTRALGSLFCSSNTASPVLVGLDEPMGHTFLAL